MTRTKYIWNHSMTANIDHSLWDVHYPLVARFISNMVYVLVSERVYSRTEKLLIQKDQLWEEPYD